jgi:ADP-ribose pyrophosphatase YjhB (NUDIX family)/predicted DNA-binding WGR domain protein
MPRKTQKRHLRVVVACVLDLNTSDVIDSTEQQRASVPKVLLARRKEAEQKEIHLMWELPGGKLEYSETEEQAVKREVEEETGYQVEIVSQLPFPYTTEWKYEGFIQYTVIYCYECRVRGRSQEEAPDDHKIKEVKWFEFDEIDFSRVLPGSREFIWHIAKKHSIDLAGYKPKIAYALLTLVEPSQNMSRYYSITLQIEPSAEHPYTVTTTRGRLDWRGHGRPIIKTFVSDREARDEILHRLKLRRSHGYALNHYSDNFPFKAFLETFPEPKDSAKQLSLW